MATLQALDELRAAGFVMEEEYQARKVVLSSAAQTDASNDSLRAESASVSISVSNDVSPVQKRTKSSTAKPNASYSSDIYKVLKQVRTKFRELISHISFDGG